MRPKQYLKLAVSIFSLTVVISISSTAAAWPGQEPAAILLSGSTRHPDSIQQPENGQVLEENLLTRYLTEGQGQVILPRDSELQAYYFKVFPMSHNDLELVYDLGAQHLELFTQFSSDTLTDTIPPAVTQFYPPAGSIEIPVRTELMMILSEEVMKDTGRILIYKEDSLVYDLDVQSDSVVVESDTVRILPGVLERNSLYRVSLTDSCFTDLSGNAAVDLIPEGSWNFQTISKDLYFSEYIEGEGYLKGFELFNPRSDTLNLDNYRVHYSRNGSGYNYIYTFPDSTLLPPSHTYAVLNAALGGLDSLQLPAGCQVDVPSSTVVSFNGNDALGLEKTTDNGLSWYPVDVLGYPDSTSNWAVAGISDASVDHTLMRKGFVRIGNTDWGSCAGTNHYDSQWRVYPLNYFENLGYQSWPASSDAGIIDFTLPGWTDSVRIVSDSSRIYIYLLPGDPSDSILPVTVISEYAWMQPPGPVWPADGVLHYQVQAEDRITLKEWEVILESPSAEIFHTLRELKDSACGDGLILYAGEAYVTAIHDSLVFIQDSTAGLAVCLSGYDATGLEIGDILTDVAGYADLYEGISCLRPDREFTLLPEPAGEVRAIELLIRDVLQRPDVYGSMLITIRNVRFTGSGEDFQADTDYVISQGSDSVSCRVSFFDDGLPGTLIPVFATLRGILLETGSGLYIAPRMTADISSQPDGFLLPGARELQIVPNPGTGIFTIPASHQISGPARISVFDLNGQPVLEAEHSDIQSTPVEINLEHVADGTYLLFMTTLDYLYINILIKAE